MANLRIENLTFTFPGAQKPVLQSVNLEIRQGEFLLLCGKSGSGKTTLLRHLRTVLAPHGQRSGSITVDGVPLDDMDPREQAARIGFVMQNPDDQIVTDKVWHELAFGLENLGCARSVMRLRVAEMASYFGIQGWFHREVSELSGGQKQLLNLASVMAMQPEVLILDEPTSQLDPIAASDFLNTLRKINRELGTTILVTEHRTEDVFPSADRVVVMEQGRITACADPRTVSRQLFESSSELFPSLPAPARAFYTAGAAGQCPLTVREGRTWLTEAYADRAPAVRELPPQPEFRSEGTPALELREVWFRYEKDSPDILKGTTFTVPQGSLYAILGGNGTGKSTTLRSICGICRPYRGQLRLLGKKLSQYKKGELFRGNLAMLPQDPKSIFVTDTVGADLREMGASAEKTAWAAELCQVTQLLEKHPYDLSGGEIQRAALAKVLLTEPKLLLLDEPTKGLDGFFKQRLAQLLRQLCGQGTTVVMVSHDVEFCAQYADLVGMFFDGQLLTAAAPRQFFGANSFYTTAANRMSRCVFRNAVTAEDVAELYCWNRGQQ